MYLKRENEKNYGFTQASMLYTNTASFDAFPFEYRFFRVKICWQLLIENVRFSAKYIEY